MNSLHNRVPPSTDWHPVAFERRVYGSTYLRVEQLWGRWELPWRFSIVRRAGAHTSFIVATGERGSQQEAMDAAVDELKNKTKGDKIAARMKAYNAWRKTG